MQKFIANVFVARDQTVPVADYWRGKGFSVRIVPRVLRAGGVRTEVFVVLVTETKKSGAVSR